MFRILAVACALIAIPAATLSKVVNPPPPDAPIEEARKFFTEDPDAPMVAPEGYDVTIVEYLDYQCPACRTTREPLRQLLKSDKKIRVIFRDWPIFGPASETAARLAVASKYQGKYVAFHDALLAASRPLDDDKIKAAAAKASVDWDQLQKDLKLHERDIDDLLARNYEQAEMLGLDGTPGFIIGATQSFGGMTLKDLQESVRKARLESKKSKAGKVVGES